MKLLYHEIIEKKEQFIQNGYTVIPLELSNTQRTIALEKYERLIKCAESLGKQGMVKTRKSTNIPMNQDGWAWGCDHIFNPLLREQDLLSLASLDPLPKILKQILGKKIRFSGGHGHWSPKFYDYYLHWHRDTRRENWNYGNPDTQCHVQVCIALNEEQVVYIVPGSHTRDLDSHEARYITSDRFAKHPQQIVPKIPAGHVLLLNTYTLHRAQCAKENIRRSLHFGFTRVGAKEEPGRIGKIASWLEDEQFFQQQSSFLKECIKEQILFHQKLRSLGAEVI